MIDSSFEPFIPADAKVLAGVQIAKLQAAPLYRTHKEQLDVRQLQAFSERTGLDPTRDLSEILITWDGKQFLAMARGHFSQSQGRTKAGVARCSPEVVQKVHAVWRRQ